METGLPNMLQCAQDLAMKAFVASHCATCQLEAEGSAASWVMELEARIAALEQDKVNLQASLSASLAEAEETSKALAEAH